MNLPRVIVPQRHFDERGWFSETFHEARLRGLGITARFVQDNQSYSKRAGTLRGMHFQVPPAEQAKLISVQSGRIFDVAVDLRRGSPTFGKYASAELSAGNSWQLYIPGGFAHGFLTLENDVTVNYKASNYYAPASEGGIRWDDPGYRRSVADSRQQHHSLRKGRGSFLRSRISTAHLSTTAARSSH